MLVGVKNCDITSLLIQDFVFKDTDPPDPFYTKLREDTLIISSDCSMVADNCFCTALGITPYPEKGFDLNLFNEMDDYVTEVGSEKGKALIRENKRLFLTATKAQIENRISARESFKEELTEHVKGKDTPGKDKIAGCIKKSYENADIWKHHASTCIECGACNFCCPTCHCFLLTDQKKGMLNARYKSWDACLYNRFARVAGGANPRKHLYERLRNRFDKKFDFFPNVLDMIACTGCGRCIEACPGKIDIREVLKSAIEGRVRE